ncbi:MAG TPA: alanine racemase [Candidatus Polarisedimenticolia bacterium]|nr:alanine racemase [Candidatus Polarisedimenticolia bacterium]
MAHRLSGPRFCLPAGLRAAWVEVDLDRLAANVRCLRARAAGRPLLAMVKADAYGHGAVEVSRRLAKEGVERLGVAIPEEGHALRAAGIALPILVLGAAEASQLRAMADAGLTPAAYSERFLQAILEEGRRLGRPLPFHLKIDTGMGRLGIQPARLGEALRLVAAAKGAGTLEGVFTHLSCSDDPSDPHTARQLALFEEALRAVREAGFTSVLAHAANSGGLLDFPGSLFDLARPGIALYGMRPSAASRDAGLRPLLSFKTRLVLVKELPAGQSIGYGREFVASRPSRIGTIAAGYADGISRMCWGRGHALVRGAAAPYAGRISMDHSMIDLTGVEPAEEGDEVVLIGEQGGAAVTADQFAAWSGTIAYEALCRIGPRVPRFHHQRG